MGVSSMRNLLGRIVDSYIPILFLLTPTKTPRSIPRSVLSANPI